MEEKRKSERRSLETIATFPLHLARGCVAFERRYIPSRRLNDISVKEVGCMDFVSEVIRQEK